MTLGKVAGTVVSTNKEPLLEGIRFLVVEKVRYPDMSGTGDYLVAMDAMGAGVGELVMVVAGSSSRLTEVTKDRPADATVTAIVDEVDLEGATVYRKYG